MKLLIALAAGLPVALAPAAGGGARDFELGLDEVERTMAVRRWGPARDALLELLEAHREADYVFARATELRAMLGQCALWVRYPEPDPSALVAGEVVDWDRASGRVRVRYRGAPGSPGDFERMGPYAVHPLEFVGPYQVELRGRVPAAGASGLAVTPAVSIGVRPEGMLVLTSGHGPVVSGGQLVEVPPRVTRVDARGSTESLAQGTSSPAAPGAAYTLRVDVDGRGARATWNGRSLVSWRASKLAGGRVAVADAPGLEELVLSGHADSAWLASRVDAAAQTLRARFRSEVPEREYVPEWLLAGPPRRAAGSTTDSAAGVEGASAAGAAFAGLGDVERLLARASRGPAWPRSWTHRSRRYEVRTDVDERTGELVAATLEETTLALRRLLGDAADLARVPERALVFVFSSQPGYRAYVDELGVRSPENAAGLYTPLLRQLLLLHVGDRDTLVATARHENVHLYLDARLEQCPPWLEEGLAEYLETLRLERGHVVDGVANEGHVRYLTRPETRWRPLAELLALDLAGFYADGLRAYAQAWALVHYLARGEGAPRGRLRELIADLAAGGDAAAAVARHLGPLLPDLDARVRAHVLALR